MSLAEYAVMFVLVAIMGAGIGVRVTRR